jgi:serine protease Do
MLKRTHLNRVTSSAIGAMIGALILVNPVAGQIPNLKSGGTVPTLAPLVREVTPAVVNISVHGKIREENPLYRDPLFREYFRCSEATGERDQRHRLRRHR